MTRSSDRWHEPLSPQDVILIHQLREQLSSKEMRFNRNRKLATFGEQLRVVWQFCIRNDQDDSKRCLACGICWLDTDTLAMNAARFRWLIGKSKSSINNNLAMMEFLPVPATPENTARLIAAIPSLGANAGELRRWTIRKESRPTSCPLTPLPPVAEAACQLEQENLWDDYYEWQYDDFC
jgi:hypothetical protein